MTDNESKHTPETALALARVAIFDRGIGWQADATATLKALAAEVERLSAPIDMVLHCPRCRTQHIDAPKNCTLHECHLYGVCYAERNGRPEMCDKWDNPSHRSHLCQYCGHTWRPADVPTNGVPAIKTKGKQDTPRDDSKPTTRDYWVKAAASFIKEHDKRADDTGKAVAILKNLIRSLDPFPGPGPGSGLTQCDMHDDESY